MTQNLTVPTVLADFYAAAPSYARPGDAGADLRSNLDLTIQPGERALVGTGVSIALPEGTVGLVHPRSGLAAKHGVTVLNAPGTIDSGYRGELKVILINHGDAPFKVSVGDRIAQLVVQRFEQVSFELVDTLDASERGTNGCGSTGVR